MAKTWSITGPAKTEVKDGSPAEIMFSITNILAEPVSGLVRILPQAPLTPSSFKPPPDSNLSFAANETKAYTFKFDPTGLDAGTYMYEFTVAPPANPNDPMADRITSSAEVLQKKPPRKWWIFAVIAGVLILAGVGAYLLLGGSKVPDVAGMTAEEATKTLADAGYEVDARPEEADKPNGELVGTDPEAGSKADEGSTVVLLLSTGPAIPPVSGPAETAAADLEELGFQVAVVSESHPTIPNNEAVRTDPAAGARAAPGQAVTLVASSGPATPQDVLVPKVTGLTLDEATALLESRGLGIFSECHFDLAGDGLVFDQTPNVDWPVEPGSDVSVQIRARCFLFPVDWIIWEELEDVQEIPDFDFDFDLPDFPGF